jgi:hypothetical protein
MRAMGTVRELFEAARAAGVDAFGLDGTPGLIGNEWQGPVQVPSPPRETPA